MELKINDFKSARTNPNYAIVTNEGANFCVTNITVRDKDTIKSTFGTFKFKKGEWVWEVNPKFKLEAVSE